MKIGIRDINIKNRIRSRTTAKWERQIKSSINPFYGKKGMGWIRDPKRALYNKIYHKTTISAEDVVRGLYDLRIDNINNVVDTTEYSARIKCNAKMLKILLLQIVCIVFTVIGMYPFSLIAILLMFGYIKPYMTYRKERKNPS